MYWGDQPFTAGPVYIGSIICFLFVLGILVAPTETKVWLIASTIFFIALSMGKNLAWFNDIMFDYFPMYNKFRVPAMILVIAQLAMPTLGIYALFQILNDKPQKDKIKQVAVKIQLCMLVRVSFKEALFITNFFFRNFFISVKNGIALVIL